MKRNELIEIKSNKRQWRIEQLLMSKMLLIRASREIGDATCFNALQHVDELLTYEIDEQRFMENKNIYKLKYIEHISNHCDCEFVDDFMTQLHGDFDKLYEMNFNEID